MLGNCQILGLEVKCNSRNSSALTFWERMTGNRSGRQMVAPHSGSISLLSLFASSGADDQEHSF